MELPASEAPESFDNNESHVEATEPWLGWCSVIGEGLVRVFEERRREGAHHSCRHLQHLHLAA